MVADTRTLRTDECFVDMRFGFPVELLHVPMKEVRGAWTPFVNANQLRMAVLSKVALQPTPLTGQHVRFIRLWLEKTMAEFGRELDVTHAAVSKWEARQAEATGMTRGTEFLVRFMVLERLPPETLEVALTLLPSSSATDLLAEIRRRLTATDGVRRLAIEAEDLAPGAEPLSRQSA